MYSLSFISEILVFFLFVCNEKNFFSYFYFCTGNFVCRRLFKSLDAFVCLFHLASWLLWQPLSPINYIASLKMILICFSDSIFGKWPQICILCEAKDNIKVNKWEGALGPKLTTLRNWMDYKQIKKDTHTKQNRPPTKKN